ncbi:MAG: hypothetical protein ACR2QC_06545 [Gammaproteobacteria bacterium]
MDGVHSEISPVYNEVDGVHNEVSPVYNEVDGVHNAVFRRPTAILRGLRANFANFGANPPVFAASPLAAIPAKVYPRERGDRNLFNPIPAKAGISTPKAVIVQFPAALRRRRFLPSQEWDKKSKKR